MYNIKIKVNSLEEAKRIARIISKSLNRYGLTASKPLLEAVNEDEPSQKKMYEGEVSGTESGIPLVTPKGEGEARIEWVGWWDPYIEPTGDRTEIGVVSLDGEIINKETGEKEKIHWDDGMPGWKYVEKGRGGYIDYIEIDQEKKVITVHLQV